MSRLHRTSPATFARRTAGEVPARRGRPLARRTAQGLALSLAVLGPTLVADVASAGPVGPEAASFASDLMPASPQWDLISLPLTPATTIDVGPGARESRVSMSGPADGAAPVAPLFPVLPAPSAEASVRDPAATLLEWGEAGSLGALDGSADEDSGGPSAQWDADVAAAAFEGEVKHSNPVLVPLPTGARTGLAGLAGLALAVASRRGRRLLR